MPRYICHHEGLFFEWSTVCDAPVTYAVPREEFEKYYREEYGNRSMGPSFEDRMNRAIEKGTSGRFEDSLADLIAENHAGENGEELSWDEIWSLITAERE